MARGEMHFGIVTVQAWLHLLFSLLSTSMLMCAHSTAHLIIYARNLADAPLKTAVADMFWENLHVVDLRHDTAPKSVRSYVCHLKIKEMVHGWDILRN